MSTTNFGNQILTWDYKSAGKSELFNVVNYKLLEKGIYEGGDLSFNDATHINVAPFVCYITDTATGVGVRVETTTSVILEVSSGSPFIVARMAWSNVENNYMDLLAVGFGSILTDDLILGRCLFPSGSLSATFDYARKSTVYNIEKRNSKTDLTVIPTEPFSDKVHVYGGTFFNSEKQVTVTGSDSASFSGVSPNTITNARIDLVYIDDAGAIQIEQGVDEASPTAPEYNSRKVLAEIYLDNTDDYIDGTGITLVNSTDSKPLADDVNNSYKGKSDITISDYDNDSAPQVKAGSIFENNGVLVTVSSDATPTGYSGIKHSSTFYLYYSGSSPYYSNAIPIWSDSKQGWYNGNDRAFFSMYKDADGTLYQSKNILEPLHLRDELTTTNIAIVTISASNWTSRTSAADNNWRGITYGNGLFVAVSETGNGNRVMTSPDGINWTSRTSAEDNGWKGVTYGNGLFVAVASSGAGNSVMTSPDGISWTSRVSAADNNWLCVTYGNGLFVAAANSGTDNRVMTSPDGINWTSRTSVEDNSWRGITYGNGLFVAVAETGTGNGVMTSPDGINWTSRTTTINNFWKGVTYGNGLFVAVAYASSDRVMTSPDGINWTSRTPAANNSWVSVTYGNGLFVAVSETGNGNRVMTSPDGINWTSRVSAANNNWLSVTYGNGLFVAVASSGTDNRVMTSSQIGELF